MANSSELPTRISMQKLERLRNMNYVCMVHEVDMLVFWGGGLWKDGAVPEVGRAL
jgi:hypothetical protein